MLAAHIQSRGRLELVESPEPSIEKDGEVIFQPSTACLCGSDLPYFDAAESYPLPVGMSLHEMVGSIVESSVERYSPGDKVLAVPLNQQGFFERYAVDAGRVIPLVADLAEDLAVLAQPLGTAIHALKKIPHLIDLDVAIVGQGPMGQIFAACLKNMGAREIIAIDLLESRLETSPENGATRTICSSREDPLEAVLALTGGRGADMVIECVGHSDQALDLCVELCRPDGQILCFGVPPESIEIKPWKKLFYKNVRIYTSVNPDFERDFPLAMRWIAEGRMDLSSLLTHHYPLSEAQKAFETFRDRTDGALKVILEFPA
tara:strand:+ start:543 stop:1496 length:954 start_codon:yes stop_codon:yes gene_type:complete